MRQEGAGAPSGAPVVNAALCSITNGRVSLMSSFVAEFNLWLVLASYAIATFGSLSGLLTSRNIPGPDGKINYTWLTISAIMLGAIAVWCMHFVGMLAYQPGIPITYDTQITLLSLVLPIVMMAGGLWAAYRWKRSLVALAVAAVIMGFGIAAMHYTGMMAMRVAADMTHEPGPVVASVIIGVVASFAALYIVREFSGVIRYACAPIMGLAVCALHYTGMYGFNLIPVERDINYFQGAVTSQQMLFIIVIATTVGILASTQLVWWREEREDRMRASHR